MTPHWLSKLRRRAGAVAAMALLLAGCASNADEQGPDASSAATVRSTLETDARSEASKPAASPYGNYLAGLFANNRGDLDSSAAFMAEALADDPKNPELLRQTFLLQTSIGDMDRAVALARRMGSNSAHHGAATVLRMLAHVRDGEHGEARKALDALSGRGLSQLLRPLMTGWLSVAEGNAPDSVAQLEGLNAINGIALLRQVHTALIHDLSGRPEKARSTFAKVTKDADALSLRLAWLAANFYAREGERDRALALMDTYLDTSPGSMTARAIRARLDTKEVPPRLVENPSQGIAEALFNVAGLLNREGATDLALLYSRLSLYIHPEFGFGRMLLGEILENQQRHEHAIRTYERVSPNSPFHYAAQLRIASELRSLDRTEAAISMLENVAQQAPKRYEPLYRVGNIERAEENFAAAAKAYERALARLDKTVERHWTLYYFFGISLERLDRWSKAETQFKRALDLKPEQPYVMNYLAYSWVEQKINLQQAQEMLKQAVSERPDDGFIVDSMGWVYYRLGQYYKAVKYLERAVELRPNDPVINDHLGDAYWKVGRRREARFQWHRALGLDPEKDVMSQIRAKLDGGLDAVAKPNG